MELGPDNGYEYGMSRELTFFVNDVIEELTVAAIAEEAGQRGWATRLSRDLSAPADVGFYVSHVYDLPAVRSAFSVIMLHDLGQQQTSWPHFWQVEPWARFDVGLLPGPRWQAMHDMEARRPGWVGPRLGVYEVGWPKADRLFAQSPSFQRDVAQLRASLAGDPGPYILYAPTYENDGKQEDVVQACRGLEATLLIKQAVWPDAFPDMQRNIREMADRHRGRYPRVHVLDPGLDIMVALGLAQVLITDESNVMFEALLREVPTISVQDWLVPCEKPARRVKAQHDFLIRSTRAGLRDDLQRGLAGGCTPASFGLPQPLSYYQGQWFSHRGHAARSIMDVVEWTAGREPGSLSGPAPILQRCEIERTRLAAWRAEVERSLSWRMTRPLRALTRRARRSP